MLYAEAVQIAKDRGFEFPEVVHPVSKYYAYADGMALICDSAGEARGISPMIEHFFANSEEMAAAKEARKQFNRIAFDIWQNSLKEEYSDFVKWRIFDTVYQEACSENLYGNDAVAQKMKDLSQFIRKILEDINK